MGKRERGGGKKKCFLSGKQGIRLLFPKKKKKKAFIFFFFRVEAVVIYHWSGSGFVAMAMMVFNPEPNGSRALPEARQLLLLAARPHVCQENGFLAHITHKPLYFPPKSPNIQYFFSNAPLPPRKYLIKPNPDLQGVTSGTIWGKFSL